jgi:hypothetical protein
MDFCDNALGAAPASRGRPRDTHPRPLCDPELATLVGDNVFACQVAAHDAVATAPARSDALVPRRLAVA